MRKVDANDPMPRYYQVYSSLLDRIQSGEFGPNTAMPTEREVGEEYGVSRITAIKALDMLERDGYVVRQQGRGTFVADRSDRSPADAPDVALRALALVTFSIGHPFVSSILVGLASAAARRGFSLHVTGSVNSSEDEASAVEDAIRRGARGLVINPWREYRNADLLSELCARGFPMVMVDRYYREIATDHVVYENEQAGYDITCALIGQGHKRIALVPSQEQRTTSVRERLSGYRRALEEHGLSYDEDLIWSDLPGTFTQREGSLSDTPATDRLLLQHMKADKPTALLAVNADVADLLIDTICSDSPCSERQPEKLSGLSLATFSHKEFRPGTPLVSVVALHSGETLGSKAADILIGRLNGSLPPEPQHLHLPMPILRLASSLLTEGEYRAQPGRALPVSVPS